MLRRVDCCDLLANREDIGKRKAVGSKACKSRDFQPIESIDRFPSLTARAWLCSCTIPHRHSWSTNTVLRLLNHQITNTRVYFIESLYTNRSSITFICLYYKDEEQRIMSKWDKYYLPGNRFRSYLLMLGNSCCNGTMKREPDFSDLFCHGFTVKPAEMLLWKLPLSWRAGGMPLLRKRVQVPCMCLFLTRC